MTLPGTSERVPRHTARRLNERIERMTLWNLEYYAGHPEQIEDRLRELDQEWDIERTLEANAASVTLIGVVFGTLFSRKWFLLPAMVGGFLLQHALQGWCPPMGIFRRLGVRTQAEIDMERYALKALRGDFINVHSSAEGETPARKIFDAVGKPYEQMAA